VVTTVVPCLGI